MCGRLFVHLERPFPGNRAPFHAVMLGSLGQIVCLAGLGDRRTTDRERRRRTPERPDIESNAGRDTSGIHRVAARAANRAVISDRQMNRVISLTGISLNRNPHRRFAD